MLRPHCVNNPWDLLSIPEARPGLLGHSFSGETDREVWALGRCRVGDGWPQAPEAENSTISPAGAASKLSHLHNHLWAAEPQKESDEDSAYDLCCGSSRWNHTVPFARHYSRPVAPSSEPQTRASPQVWGSDGMADPGRVGLAGGTSRPWKRGRPAVGPKLLAGLAGPALCPLLCPGPPPAAAPGPQAARTHFSVTYSSPFLM